MRNYRKFTTAIKVTGKVSPLSKTCNRCKGSRKWRKKMADTPSPLTNLSSYAKTHSSPQIRCVNTKRRSPGRPSFPSTRYCEAWPGPKNIQIRFDCSLCGQLSQRSWTLTLRWPQLLWTLGASSWGCHQRDGKTQNKHSTRADGYLPAPGDRGKIQPHRSPLWKAKSLEVTPLQLFFISTNLVSLKVEGKGPKIRSGLWKCTTSK